MAVAILATAMIGVAAFFDGPGTKALHRVADHFEKEAEMVVADKGDEKVANINDSKVPLSEYKKVKITETDSWLDKIKDKKAEVLPEQNAQEHPKEQVAEAEEACEAVCEDVEEVAESIQYKYEALAEVAMEHACYWENCSK